MGVKSHLACLFHPFKEEGESLNKKRKKKKGI